MAEIIPFKRPSLQEKHRGKTLCKSGFHKWSVETQLPFDVKSGKLLTLYRCCRCGATRTEAR
jgi:hypothetical protein